MKKQIFSIVLISLMPLNCLLAQVTDTGDKVGIGTSTPQSKLDVADGTVHLNAHEGNKLVVRSSPVGETNDKRLVGLTLSLDQTYNQHLSSQKSAGIFAQSMGSWGNYIDLLFYTRNPSVAPYFEERMRITSSGRVGIGTNSPKGKMEVFDNAVHVNAHEANSFIIRRPYAGPTNDMRMVGMTLSLDTPERQHEESQKSAGLFAQSTGSWGNSIDLLFYTSNSSFQERMRITAGGNVGIGTADTKGYKLAVAGNVVAEEVTVKLQSNWPDFVFEERYPLRSLPEVEAFIKQYKHLPDVPSEAEVLANGIQLGAMDAKLLQKIEELTLYQIELLKIVNALQQEVNQLKENQK